MPADDNFDVRHRPRQWLRFGVNGQTFYLRVASLLNKLIGEDFGAVEISSQAPSDMGVDAAGAKAGGGP